MGKSNKKRGSPINWDEITDIDNHDGSVGHNSNGFGGGNRNRDEFKPNEDSNISRNIEDQGTSDPQTYPNFGPYLQVIEDLKAQMVAGQQAMKNVHLFYTRQQRDIQDAVETRRQLTEMKKRCKEYSITIRTLRNEEMEKDEKLAEKLAHIKEEERELEGVKNDFMNHKKILEEEKGKFEKIKSKTEAEQKLKLLERRRNLEEELNERYEKRVKAIEEETKRRQDDDGRKIVELEASNNELLRYLEDEKGKLRESEGKHKDAEKLKILYEAEGDKLRDDLKLAENEFGLNTATTEFYKDSFSKIHSSIQDISSQYFKELHVGDLNALHDKVEKLDECFTSVPISASEVSAELRVAHARRVISTQLRNVIWQPFSSETTQSHPEYISVFQQISEGLLKHYGKINGLRAARLCTALTMRGLQSQPPPKRLSSASRLSPPLSGRAQIFSDKVMAVLSLLVKPSLHSNLRNSLLDLAVSAISVWDIAQTDEREVIVDPEINPERHKGWHKSIPKSQSNIIVLFPRIYAQGYSRPSASRAVIIPGRWVDPEPELSILETSIHDGEGLAKWSELVLEGEEEEEDRKVKEEDKKIEEKKRILQEGLKKLEKPIVGTRRMSQSQRESNAGLASKSSAVLRRAEV